LQPAYRGLRSQAEKRAFRSEWAAKRLEVLRETKFRTTTLRKQDIEKGIYLPFYCIVDKEGGASRPQAIEAATKYVAKAAKMGSIWVSWNTMTERHEFLYIRKVHIEVFEKAWGLHKAKENKPPPSGAVQDDGQRGAAAAGAQGTGAAGQDKDEKKAKEETAGSKAKQKGKHSKGDKNEDGTTKQGKEKDEKKTAFDMVVATARKTKQTFTQVTTKAKSLRQAIANQPAWQWANDAKNLADISGAQQAVEDSMTDFIIDFMTEEVKEISKKYGLANMEVECKKMSSLLDPLLSTLLREVQSLMNMHSARMKAGK